MPELTIEQAEQLLKEHGAYSWLLDSGQKQWSVSDAMEQLATTGMSISRGTIIGWFKEMPHTQDFGKLGLWASYDDLVLFFAKRMRNERVG